MPTTPNTKRPGLPDYTGPRSGMFALLHHGELYEHSDDVMERVEYVKHKKPPNEVADRLYHMLYIDPDECPEAYQRKPLYDDYEAKCNALCDDYWAKRKPLDDDYEAKRKALDDDYEAKRKPLDDAVLAYLTRHIPNHKWNGSEIVFTKVEA